MSARQFRKKPVVIEAVQFDGVNHAEIHVFTQGQSHPACCTDETCGESLTIPTLEGDHLAKPGDVIIKGVHGEFYPCKPDIFAKTYEDAAIAPTPDPAAIARAAMEAAAAKCEAARDHRNKQRAELTPHDPAQVQRWMAGALQANVLAEQIRALMEPAALAEIVKGSQK